VPRNLGKKGVGMIAMDGIYRRSRDPVSYAIGVILIHFVISVVHGLAHSHLGIRLSGTQQVFVAVVITAAPLIAGYLLWRSRLRAGGALLAASMAGAFIFGVYYHFITPGGDNVNRAYTLGSGNWQNLFEETAIEIGGLEIVGAMLGLVLVLRSYMKRRGASPAVANREI
jgi:hypothetical protein